MHWKDWHGNRPFRSRRRNGTGRGMETVEEKLRVAHFKWAIWFGARARRVRCMNFNFVTVKTALDYLNPETSKITKTFCLFVLSDMPSFGHALQHTQCTVFSSFNV